MQRGLSFENRIHAGVDFRVTVPLRECYAYPVLQGCRLPFPHTSSTRAPRHPDQESAVSHKAKTTGKEKFAFSVVRLPNRVFMTEFFFFLWWKIVFLPCGQSGSWLRPPCVTQWTRTYSFPTALNCTYIFFLTLSQPQRLREVQYCILYVITHSWELYSIR